MNSHGNAGGEPGEITNHFFCLCFIRVHLWLHAFLVTKMAHAEPPLHEPLDGESPEYQTICGLAVVSLILAILAPLALVDPLGAILPVGAIAVGWAALRRIARNAPALSGRRLALWAVGLSLLFLAAVPAEWLSYRWQIRREAIAVGDAWFAMLRDNRPQMAFQLTLEPRRRRPLDNTLAKYYREVPELRDGLAAYVRQPLVRTLLTLGRAAEVRWERIEDQERLYNCDRVDPLYVVGYEEGGRKKSFSVVLHLARLRLSTGAGGGRAVWQLIGAEEAGR